MHVLHLSTWHPFINGVSGTFIVEQCTALRAAGADVGLIFARIEGLREFSPRRLMRGLPGFVRLDNPVPTYGFKTWNIPGTRPVHRPLCEIALRNRYRAYVKAVGKPDVLHAHVALETGAIARRIAAETGLEYVVTEHSSEIFNGLKEPARRAAARQVYEGARNVIAVSDELAERISAICPGVPIKVIPNLVRDAIFEMRRSAGRHGDRLIVVSIGGLVSGKRTRDAIDAIAGLPESLRSRIEYLIIGDGPQREPLKRQARDAGLRARFFGNLSHDDAMRLLAKADLLVHASAYETFGLVIAEAMALGVPVVSTRCGGPDGLIVPETGRLVAIGDVSALRNGIQEVLEASDYWLSRRDAIAHIARERFHEKTVATAIIGEYQ